MPTGTVLRFERNSGFGFIRTDDETELFVHHSGLADRTFLVAGQRVEFQVEDSDRGPRAVGVRVLREVPPKRQRRLDWRGHRGRVPRPGTPPKPAEPPEPQAVDPETPPA